MGFRQLPDRVLFFVIVGIVIFVIAGYIWFAPSIIGGVQNRGLAVSILVLLALISMGMGLNEFDL